MEQLAKEISTVLGISITTQYLWHNRNHVMAWLRETFEYGANDTKASEAARLYRRLSWSDVK